jgi:hypothetical protein
MAAPPSTANPPSWNPAVPPPPVTGALVGYGLYEGLGYGLYEGLGDGLTDADGLVEALALALAEALDEALTVLLALALALTEPLAEGDNTVTDDDTDGLPLDVQAESATQASTVARPPVAVSLTRCAVHAMAVRAFIEPPHTLGNDHFPVAGRRNRRRTETAYPAFGRRPCRAENGSGQNGGHHNGKPRPRR